MKLLTICQRCGWRLLDDGRGELTTHEVCPNTPAWLDVHQLAQFYGQEPTRRNSEYARSLEAAEGFRP